MNNNFKNDQIEDSQVIFWLFIDELHKYQNKISLIFKKNEKKNYHLQQSTIHRDVFFVKISKNEQIHFKSQVNYYYRITEYGKKYRTKELERFINHYRLKNYQQIEIFDTPDLFSEKSFWKTLMTIGLYENALLKQLNKEECLLNFCQQNTSIQTLLNLRQFMEHFGYYKLQSKYNEISIHIVINNLMQEEYYYDKIDLFFEYYEKLDNETKNKNIFEYANSLSKYFTKFEGKIEKSDKYKNKLIELYRTKTNLDQRIQILLGKHCILHENQVEDFIGKKDFNNCLLSNPQHYISMLSQPTKYQTAFKKQISKIITQSIQKSKCSLDFIQANKQFIQNSDKRVKEEIQEKLFCMKDLGLSELRDKLSFIVRNIKEIRSTLDIPYFKARNYLVQFPIILKNTYCEQILDTELLELCFEYKIDIFDYPNLLQNTIIELTKENNNLEKMFENILNKNPFQSVDKFLEVFFEKKLSIQSHYTYIPHHILTKSKIITFVKQVYEKQQIKLKEIQQLSIQKDYKERQNQQLEFENKNISFQHQNNSTNQLDHTNLQKNSEIIEKENNQLDQNIITDDEIKQSKHIVESKNEYQQKNAIQNIKSEENEEDKLKEQLFQKQKTLALSEYQISKFVKNISQKIEQAIFKTPISDLCQISNLKDLTEEQMEEFKIIYKGRTYQKIKNECSTDDLFIKNFQSVQKSYNLFKGNEVLFTLNSFDQLAVEKLDKWISSGEYYEQFDQTFICQYLKVCDKTKEFYKKMDQNIQTVSQIINTKNLQMKQFKTLFNKLQIYNIFEYFSIDLKYYKKILDQWLESSKTKLQNYKTFFHRFQDFFPQEYETLKNYTLETIQFNQIELFLSSFQQYDSIADYYKVFSESQIFKCILSAMLNDSIEKQSKQIENLKDIQNIQGNQENQQILFSLRISIFSSLMIDLVDNLYDFCFIVFNVNRGQIISLDNFSNIINITMGQFINNQNNQQPLKIFNQNTNLEDLKPYCGNNMNEILESLRNFHKIYLIQTDMNIIDLNMKKCYMAIFYLEKSSQIKKIGEIIKADWKIQQNHQLINLLNSVEKFQDIKKQALKDMINVEIDKVIIEEFECIIKQANIERNMTLYIQSQIIINKTQINNEKNITYLDMRDFIGDNDYDLSSFLTVLNEFSPFFTKLSELQNDLIKNNKNYSVLSGILSINNLIESNIKTNQKLLQWDEITKNFHKIASIESNIDKKKSYLNLLKKLYQIGKISIRVSQNNQQATFIIECEDKCYSEQEIREISSRVLIEQHSINAIFNQKDLIESSKQKSENSNEQETGIMNLELKQEDIIKLKQKQQQEQNMEKFKKQLELTQDLKQIIQDMEDYGYFLFDQKEYIFNNKQNMYQNNMTQMRQKLQSFEQLLEQWKNQIDIVTKYYPKFSFISYSFYSELDRFLSKQIDQEKLNESITSIIKNQIGVNQFEASKLRNAFEEYQKTQKEQKLYSIARFVTQNQFKADEGGMMRMQILNYKNYYFFQTFQFSINRQEKRIRLIQYFNVKEAIYHLMLLNTDLQNLKSQFFLFCDEKTKVQDIQLFIHRYKYWSSNQNTMNFFMIINSSQNSSSINLLVDLQNDQSYFNTLYILINRNCYDEKLSCVKQNSIIDISQQHIDKLKQLKHIQQIRNNIIFYNSKSSGAGKTQSICKQSKKYNSNVIRIPTNGDGDIQKFIEQFIKKCSNNSSKKIVYHIDVYENQNIELNFLLFQMIVLKSVNFNSKRFLDLGNESIFLIEINNTLRSSLESQIFIKEYFEINTIEFNIQNLNIETLQENHQDKAIIVYKYLRGLNQCQQNNNNLYFDSQNLQQNLNQIIEINKQEYIQLINTYIINYLVQNQISPDYWQINNFISLFGSEMQKMESSIYLRTDIVEREQLRQGLKTEIVKKSFELCRKVSISSILNTFVDDMKISKEELLTRKANSLIQFSTFVQDFVTFQEQEEACLTSFFQNNQTLPQSIKALYEQHTQPLLLFDQEQRPDILIHWLMMLCNKHIQKFYGKNTKDISYQNIIDETLRNEVEKIIIQKDNFFKIAMIFLRIRSKTPVIIMGEAGIGKTALVRLLSLIMDANFKTKIIHAGVTEDEIIQFIQESQFLLKKSPNKKIVLFFDEVNTNKLVSGLFKEIIVDRCLKGDKLNENIIPIAALNPYKLKSQQQQQIMQIQIHGGIKKDLVNKIQGSDLEYTVNPIPESMYSFSWNYGGLKEKDEQLYISQILMQMNKDLYQTTQFSYRDEFIKTTLSELVFWSQQYLRNIMGRISACSLRDVKRFVTLLKNNIIFLTNCSHLKINKFDIKTADIENLAVYLSFYINYNVRIPHNEKRYDYLQEITRKFTQFTEKQMKQQFEAIEKFIINQIDVPIGIAKNYSLRQNAFILFICIINKIPVCLIGPPGSSKTLSLRQLIQSMQGINSRSEVFKNYPALMPLYYQGHIQSTSERIMEVFENASKKQQAYNSKELDNQNLSLVYIDEIGLAEISPHNPLKVLHATLEKPDISVACISNWPLDASKMNRMLTVYRMDVDIPQLVETFQSIFDEIKEQQKDVFIKKELDRSLLQQLEIQRTISKIYINYMFDLKKYDSKYEQFHGPRDFFSAAKLICSEEVNYIECEKRNEFNFNEGQCKQKILNERISKAFQRHFSGLEMSQQLLEVRFQQDLKNYSSNYKPTELIEQNLKEEPQFFISRHLMIITDDIQNSKRFLKQKLNKRKHQFFDGSDFEEDLQMQACYNVINKIVSCIEKGVVVILQNLDNIYQSLYEVLNQSYRYYSGKYFCKISFGAECSNIEISQNFKLILLVNKNQVHRMDGPLLNRFEKHLLNENMILTDQDSENIQQIIDCIQMCTKYIDIDRSVDKIISNEDIQRQHPFFRFQNINSVIYSVYYQYKLQKEGVLGIEQANQMSQLDFTNIMKRLFHLIDFYQAFLPSTEQWQLFKDCKINYVKSGYHFSLSEFIINRILKQNIQYLISEWNFFEREKGQIECQVRQFSIFSTQQFIDDSSTSSYQTIILNQISSEQNLIKIIDKFLSKGYPQKIPKQAEVFSTYQNKQNSMNNHNINLAQSSIKQYNKTQIQQEILIIVADMSKSGKDQFDRIVFTMQKIDEAVEFFLDTVQNNQEQSQYTTQLNIILLLKVDEVFNIVPINGRWEFYYIENLSPFTLFKNDSQNINESDLYNEIRTRLTLPNIFQNRVLIISDFIDFKNLTLFFLIKDQQIFSHAFKDIAYEINQERSEYEYKTRRLEFIIDIFRKDNSYLNVAFPILAEMTLFIMKNNYKIETINDLVFSYLMQRGLSGQSSSLYTSIINGLEDMVKKSLKIMIYHLEKQGLVFGMANCKIKQFEEYSINQIKNVVKYYCNYKEIDLKQLKMSKDQIFNQSENIFKFLQSYQIHIQTLKENVILQIDEFFEQMCTSARQNLKEHNFILNIFSDQIIQDIQCSIPSLDIEIQIAKAILLINNDQIKSGEQIQNKTQINLKRYKNTTDYVIPVIILIYVIKEEIIEFKELLAFYQKYISISEITNSFINQFKQMDLELSQSIQTFRKYIVNQFYEKIKPESQIVISNSLLNKSYPQFSKPFIKYLEKNNIVINQQWHDQITVLNIICTEFTNLLSEKNLLNNLNFYKITSLEYKDIKQMKSLFYQYYKSNGNQNLNKSNSNIVDNNNEIQIYERQFLKDWNKFMKQLLITSTKKVYLNQSNIQFIKILLDIEIDENFISNNQISEEFKIFLNRIFKNLKNNITIQNILQSFEMSSENIFCDEMNKQYHTEYYTFVIFSQTIQEKIFQNILKNNIRQASQFLHIIIKSDLNQLNTLQKVIYMSIFRELVIQIINNPNITESLFTQKQLQNSMEIEGEDNENFIQDINKIDKSLQSYFQNLNIDSLQVFVIRHIIYSNQIIQDFQNKSFYLSGSKWLENYNSYNVDNLKANQLNQQLDNDLSSQNNNQNKQEMIEAIIMVNIYQSNNIFNQLYQGNILENKYFPFHMINQLQSQTDFYEYRLGDQQKSLYQCLSCKNYIVYNNQEQNNDQQIICQLCKNQIDIKNQNQAIVVLQDLSQKTDLTEKLQQEKGFCLKLNNQHKDLSIKNCKPAYLRLFSLIYHTVISKSLKSINNNPWLQQTQINLYQNQPQTGQIITQQFNTQLINKTLKLGISENPMEYLSNQIKIAFDEFIQFCRDELNYSYQASTLLINNLFEFILRNPLIKAVDQVDQLNIDLIQKQIDDQIKSFNSQVKIQAQLKEDFSFISNKQSEFYYQFYPRNLRFLQKHLNSQQVARIFESNEYQKYIVTSYTILYQCLNFDLFNILSHSLQIFIQFYQKTILYFSNQFDKNQLQQLTLIDALQKIGKDDNDNLYRFYQTKFIPAWNDVIQSKEITQIIDFDISRIQEINEQTKLINLVYLNKVQSTPFYEILSFLCTTQNNLIEFLLKCSQQQSQQTSQNNELYQMVYKQYKENQDQLTKKSLQEIDILNKLIKESSYDILEYYVCYGFEESDGIKEKIISDLPNLQIAYVQKIFYKTCFIDLEKSIIFQCLSSPNQMLYSNQMSIPQEKLSKGLIESLKKVLCNKDISYDTLQKMVTIYSFFKSSSDQQAETSLSVAMKQLNLRSNVENLDRIFENHIKLKHLQSFIHLLEELNMNNLILLIHPLYKTNVSIQLVDLVISSMDQNVDYLKTLKTMIGRFIVKYLSDEMISINPTNQLLGIICDPNIDININNESFDYFQNNYISQLKVNDAYLLYERLTQHFEQIEFLKKDNRQQEINTNLLIESFSDENSKKNIRELTLRSNIKIISEL